GWTRRPPRSLSTLGAHFVWKKNGQKMVNCVNEQTHVLSNGRVHLLSWVKDAIAQDSKYTCLLISESGSKASTSSITVEGSNYQETWSREFASWRSVIGEHEKQLVCDCNKD
uniref:Ig-like domain-containing protein n=1 Tax=Naja naja TaxID=35670 RepID=A0A8C6YJ12_NAJNA